MTNNKQSSVQWLLYEISLTLEGCENSTIPHYKLMELGKQAKEMHKQEIDDTYWLGYGDHQTQNIHNLDEIFDYILGGNNEQR